MTHELKPITITPEQIIAAAQKIVNAHAKDDEGWQYTEAQWLAAVEHYLRCKVNDLLIDADWLANKDRFDVERTCDYPTCQIAPAPHSVYCPEHTGYLDPETAQALNIPPAPPWAKGNGEIIQRPQLDPEPDGDILWA